MAEQGNCDTCVNFVYDEDYEYYVCDMDLDEDDMVRFLTGNTNSWRIVSYMMSTRLYAIRCKF